MLWRCLLAWVLCGGFMAVGAEGPTDVVAYFGMCDASASVALGPSKFVVANDEDNVLRVYDRAKGGLPLQTFDLGGFLKPDPEHPEVDIEGATEVGDTVYWISSHGTNAEGKQRSSRRRFFATRFTTEGGRVQMHPIGKPYSDLVDDLANAPALRHYNLGRAARHEPKSEGALNIEALAPGSDGTSLWIGLRNPIVKGKALLIPLANPQSVIAGQRAALGSAIELDLGGLGIRSIDYWEVRKTYVIIAGPYSGGGHCRLFQWTGGRYDPPRRVESVSLADWSAETFLMYPDTGAGKLQILSDDGALMGCKQRPNPTQRSFRGGWVRF